MLYPSSIALPECCLQLATAQHNPLLGIKSPDDIIHSSVEIFLYNLSFSIEYKSVLSLV